MNGAEEERQACGVCRLRRVCGNVGGIIAYRAPRGIIDELRSLLGTRSTLLVLLTSGPPGAQPRTRPFSAPRHRLAGRPPTEVVDLDCRGDGRGSGEQRDRERLCVQQRLTASERMTTLMSSSQADATPLERRRVKTKFTAEQKSPTGTMSCGIVGAVQ